MSSAVGPRITKDGLVVYLDAMNNRSALKNIQSSNILVDPNTWTTGTGSTTGYSMNGSESEQNRLWVNDDPWGRRSVTWRTTPDSASGADGGWNSLFYPVDTNYTYRWSVWVRRYTAGTGGTFYLGLNPAPIRNDNGAEQGNPYFNYVPQSAMALNQWYLVVGHCFYEGYTGGRHPDSGWYKKTSIGGDKINDLSLGNVGAEDVRWKPGTTTTQHRTYHYYTTNTSSGLEFAFPRIDKCDGSEPSIQELLTIGESAWSGLTNSKSAKIYNNVSLLDKSLRGMSFDGDGDYATIDSTALTEFNLYNLNFWLYNDYIIPGDNTAIGGDVTDYQCLINFNQQPTQGVNLGGWTGSADNESIHIWSNSSTASGFNGMTYIKDPIPIGWHNFQFNWNGSTYDIWVDGEKKTTYPHSTAGHATLHPVNSITIGSDIAQSYNFTGTISSVSIYDRQLTDAEVIQNFNAYKTRYSSLTHSPKTVTNGLILSLDAGNPKSYPGSGTTWFNLVENGINGTLMNGATHSSQYGGSITFDGTDDYVSLPAGFSNFPTGLTIMAFANLGNPSTWERIIDFGNGPGSDNILLARNSTSNTLVFEIYNGAVSLGKCEVIDGILNNTTACYAATIDGTNCVLYRNGEVLLSFDYPHLPNNITRNNCYIGKSNFADAHFETSMEAVMLYDRALTASEIKENYNSLRGRYKSIPYVPNIITSGLVMGLDAGNPKSYSGSGTTWTNLVNPFNNASLINGPTYISQNGGGLVFDGIDDYGLIDGTGFDFSTGQTIFMILEPSESDGNRRNPYNQAYGGYGTITHEIGGNFSYYHGTNGGNGTPYQGTDSIFTVLENEVAAITLTRTPSTISWYKNGEMLSSVANEYPTAVSSTNTILLANGYTTNWLGKIHCCLLYDRGLSQSEITQLFNTYRDRYGL